MNHLLILDLLQRNQWVTNMKTDVGSLIQTLFFYEDTTIEDHPTKIMFTLIKPSAVFSEYDYTKIVTSKDHLYAHENEGWAGLRITFSRGPIWI